MKTSASVIILMLVGCCLAPYAIAQEVCDGPVLKSGSSVDTCGICVDGACPGFTSVRNDYYHCGGSGFTWCSQSNQTVGQSHMPCTVTFNSTGYAVAKALYDNCNSQVPPPPGGCGLPPSVCTFTTCSAGTTGGSPIIFPVVDGLGDPCTIAKLLKFSPSSVVQLAMSSLGGYGR